MAKLNIVQAINLALMQEMQRDPSVILLGEDVGKNGGVFRVTEELHKIFGEERVIDTPLSESAIAGASIGMAMFGLRPVAELQFNGFTYPALDQLISHAGKMRNRSRGRFSVPMVVRFPYGGGIKALEHHSDSPEAYFCHTPGLKVVVPSGPVDAKGLMISAIRDPDPVIFMEPMRIYRAIKEEVPEQEYATPIGEAKVASQGDRVTVIAWGAMVRECMAAAEVAAQRGILAEVIDLRTLSPIDDLTIMKSVKKTGRAVVVHEAPRNCGLGAEIAARIQEKAFLSLEAPVVRVTGYDVAYPLPKLENYYLPNQDKVLAAIEKVAKF
jgi:pyruvate dehydrogenase E1 component beta subunit